jgi:hypothetical protein
VPCQLGQFDLCSQPYTGRGGPYQISPAFYLGGRGLYGLGTVPMEGLYPAGTQFRTTVRITRMLSSGEVADIRSRFRAPWTALSVTGEPRGLTAFEYQVKVKVDESVRRDAVTNKVLQAFVSQGVSAASAHTEPLYGARSSATPPGAPPTSLEQSAACRTAGGTCYNQNATLPWNLPTGRWLTDKCEGPANIRCFVPGARREPAGDGRDEAAPPLLMPRPRGEGLNTTEKVLLGVGAAVLVLGAGAWAFKKFRKKNRRRNRRVR